MKYWCKISVCLPDYLTFTLHTNSMHQNASKKEKGTEKSKIYEKGEKSRRGRNKG